MCVEGTQGQRLLCVCVKSDVINHMTSPASINESDIVYYNTDWRKGILDTKYRFIFTFMFSRCRFNQYLVGKSYFLLHNMLNLNISKHHGTKTIDSPCLPIYKEKNQTLFSFTQHFPKIMESHLTVKSKANTI